MNTQLTKYLMTYASKRFLLLSKSQQEEAQKRKLFIEKYLSETEPKHFLEPNNWNQFCDDYCAKLQITKPDREEFAKWCFDYRMWQGDLFVLAPQSTNHSFQSSRRVN